MRATEMDIGKVVSSLLAGSISIPVWVFLAFAGGTLVVLAVVRLYKVRIERRPKKFDVIEWLASTCAPQVHGFDTLVSIDPGGVVYYVESHGRSRVGRTMPFEELVQKAKDGEELPWIWIAHLTVRRKSPHCVPVDQEYFFGKSPEYSYWPWEVECISDPHRNWNRWYARVRTANDANHGVIARDGSISRLDFLAELLNIFSFFRSIGSIDSVQRRVDAVEVSKKMWDATQSPVMEEYRKRASDRDCHIGGFERLMQNR